MSVELSVEQLVELLQAPVIQQLAHLTGEISSMRSEIAAKHDDIDVRFDRVEARVGHLEESNRDRETHRAHSLTAWGMAWRFGGGAVAVGSLAAYWASIFIHR